MDREAFRKRFKAYKEGKPVSEIYDAGLPKYATGTPDKFSAFVDKMGHYMYYRIKQSGVRDVDTAYENMMRQLALESNYGTSDLARTNNNFGGVGFNGKTYHKYKDHKQFIDAYVDLMTSRYIDAITAPDPATYAKRAHDKGYFTGSLADYQYNMSHMGSLNRAMKTHMQNNPDAYGDIAFEKTYEPVPYVVKPDNTRVVPIETIDPGRVPQFVQPQPKNFEDNPMSKEVFKQLAEVLSSNNKYKNGKLPGYNMGTSNESDVKINMGPKKQLSEDEVIQAGLNTMHEQPLSGIDPVMLKLVEVYAGGKFLKLAKTAFVDKLVKDYKQSYKEARLAGHGKSTAKFIAEEEIDNPALNILNGEFKVFDLFKNGKTPKFGGGLFPFAAQLFNIGVGASNSVKAAARQRLYNNVTPWGYNIPNAALEFLKGLREFSSSAAKEALWAKYLGFPQFNINDANTKGNVDDWIVESPYIPSVGNITYGNKAFRLNPAKFNTTYSGSSGGPLNDENIRTYFKKRLEQNKNNVSYDEDFGNSGLGYYTMSSGKDANGYYISYYDDWDINPLHGKSAQKWTQIFPDALKAKGDILKEIIGANPFTLYDRRYLTEDEWKSLGGYKNGKSPIHIKPANRGKFNATKKRTGKTTEELTHSKNPLTRKRAIFALNAKKWKH